MHSSPQYEDEARWWQRLLQGEQDALAYFYEKYADTLLKYGISITPNREMVQDAVQELYIQIWNRRANLSVPHSVKYYLIASLRRLILKDVINARLISEATPEVATHEVVFELEEMENDIHHKLQLAVRALPNRQQEVIFLRFFEKLSYEEITELTGLDYQVLRNTIHRAIKTLRQSLADKIDLLLPLLLFLAI
jgi:RNA polymerase sigma factor (sigma-70 family)